MKVQVSPQTEAYWQARGSIVGAFWDLDFLLFDHVLTSQAELGVTGDLLEIGALYGKSTVVLGLHARADDTVHVCDIFENEGVSEANDAENSSSYPGLARDTFERNYAAHVSKPPRIIQEFSDRIATHLEPGVLRFAHIDGGHLYETVVDDLRQTRALLGDDAVVVLDDVRALHTPGVAAAAWAAVINDGLNPFAISDQKMYATWGPSGAYAERLDAWLRRTPVITNYGYQDIAGRTVALIENPRAALNWRAHVSRWAPPRAIEWALRNSPRPHLGTTNPPRQLGSS